MKKTCINISLLLLILYNQETLLQGSSIFPEKMNLKEPLKEEVIIVKTREKEEQNNKEDTLAQPCPHIPITEFTPDIINLILFYDCDYIDKTDPYDSYELYPLIDKYRQAVINYDPTTAREQKSKFILRYPPSSYKRDIIHQLNSIQRNLQTDTPPSKSIFTRFKRFFNSDKKTDELRSLIGFMKKNICLILENTFYIQELASYLNTNSKFKNIEKLLTDINQDKNAPIITLTTLLDDLAKHQNTDQRKQTQELLRPIVSEIKTIIETENRKKAWFFQKLKWYLQNKIKTIE